MDIKGRSGNAKDGVGDGASIIPRIGKTGEVVTVRAHGSYYEAASRSISYVCQTAVAGVAPSAALSNTPPFALWNPPGSGILVAINKILLGYISGTLGSGSIVIAQTSQTTAPTGGTSLTPTSTMIGNFRRSVSSAYQGATISGTGTLVRSTGLILGAYAGGAGQPQGPTVDDCEGEMVLSPGNLFILQGIAASTGTSPLVTLGVVYEEVNLT